MSDEIAAPTHRVIHADCLEGMRELEDNSVDAIVCDPPYAISFMGRGWDDFGRKREVSERGGNKSKGILSGSGRGGTSKFLASHKGNANRNFQDWCEEWARECLRIAKPGAHLLAFGGTRTYHRLTCAIEDAGWEIRDSMMYIFGAGFPKSHDVSKAIDREMKLEREVVGSKLGMPGYSLEENKADRIRYGQFTDSDKECEITAPASEEAKRYDGFGTALKPAFEPIVLARKPLEGTVANNVLKWGTGGLNIDACRIGVSGGMTKPTVSSGKNRDRWEGNRTLGSDEWRLNGGRWPSNLLLGFMKDEYILRGESTEPIMIDEATYSELSDELKPLFEIAPNPDKDEVLSGFPVTSSGAMKREVAAYGGESKTGFLRGRSGPSNQHGDSGSASRFFATFTQSRDEPVVIDQCDYDALPAEIQDLFELLPNESKEEVLAGFPVTSGPWGKGQSASVTKSGIHASKERPIDNAAFHGEHGSASRYFYASKASRRERNTGCDHLLWDTSGEHPVLVDRDTWESLDEKQRSQGNIHPTVKNQSLMNYLVRLVTPPGGIVLDPFTGSGTTGVASVKEGFSFLGFEKELSSHQIATARIEHARSQSSSCALS